MTTSPVIALRQSIRTRLIADASLIATLGGPKVYDEAPSEAPAPYILFADTQLRDWSDQLSDGTEQFFVLSVVSTMRGLSEALSIAQRLIDLIDEAPLTLAGHMLIDLRFIAFETRREQNGRFARANLRFRATTEYL